MKTNMETINPIKPGVTAIQVAMQCYANWKGDVRFDQDITDYLLTGVVVSRPNCFGMAKVIELPDTKEPAWFVRMAVGNLRELLSCLPGYLPKICFCRRNERHIRVYQLERFIRIVRHRQDACATRLKI